MKSFCKLALLSACAGLALASAPAIAESDAAATDAIDPSAVASAASTEMPAASEHRLDVSEQIKLLRQAKKAHPNDAKAQTAYTKTLAQEAVVAKKEAAAAAKAKEQEEQLQAQIEALVADIQAREKAIDDHNTKTDIMRAELLELIKKQNELQAASAPETEAEADDRALNAAIKDTVASAKANGADGGEPSKP